MEQEKPRRLDVGKCGDSPQEFSVLLLGPFEMLVDKVFVTQRSLQHFLWWGLRILATPLLQDRLFRLSLQTWGFVPALFQMWVLPPCTRILA